MKLKDSFITYMTDDVQIMVPVGEAGFRGMVRSNKTAAFVINCLKTPCTREDIVDRMADKYEAPREILERDADRVLEVLRRVGALDE